MTMSPQRKTKSRGIQSCEPSLSCQDCNEEGFALANILIVDDDPDIRGVFQEALELLGHCVATACNGLEAIGLLSCDPLPDILLVDVMMPVMDGRELLGRIGAAPRTSGLPVILITGASPDSDDFPNACDYQALITKPFDIWDVAKCVDSLLDDRKPQIDRSSPES
jgi:CheY-like chemotaxis protein